MDAATRGTSEGSQECGRLERKSVDTSAGSHLMDSQWINSSSFLPSTGDPIEFMLEERGQSICGTFDDGQFHSRWAHYDAHQISSWRESELASAAPAEKPTATPANTLASALKRLIGAVSRRPILTPLVVPRSRCRRTAVPANTMASNVSGSRRVDSNQMSS
jgi:hypothetical protein